MVTYLYWALIIIMAIAAIAGLGIKVGNWPAAIITAGIVLLIGWASYFFYLEQIFVKRWGGVMSLTVPAGQRHLTATWKEDNLWIENYDPQTNTCYLTEYSRGSVLEGKVVIKNCNPLSLK